MRETITKTPNGLSFGGRVHDFLPYVYDQDHFPRYFYHLRSESIVSQLIGFLPKSKKYKIIPERTIM